MVLTTINARCLPVIILTSVCLLAIILVSGCLGHSKFTEPRAYICQAGNTSVAVLNPNTGAQIGEIDVQNAPAGVAISHDGNIVYVNDGSSIAVADARTNKVTGHIRTSQPTTGYLAVSDDDKHLYVACQGGLSAIDLSGGKETAFIDNVSAMGIGVSPDGKYVYTTDWGVCSLQVTNTRTNTIEKTINLIPPDYTQSSIPWQDGMVKAAGQAVGLGMSPDGRHLVVGIWAGSFAPVIDLRSLQLEQAVPLNGRSYQCVAYSPDNKRVYISHYDGNRIIVLDVSDYRPTSSLNVAASPKNIAITPDGKLMYVTHEYGNVEIMSLPDGGIVKTLDIKASRDGKNIAFNPAARLEY